MSFGKVSQPIVTSSGTPFLSGIGPTGRNVAAVGPRAVVFSSPIAAWQPVAGATKYRIEMSRTSYPWHAVETFGTPATSIVLPLTTRDAGTWFYRVRAINQNLPAGARALGLVDAGSGQDNRQPDQGRSIASPGDGPGSPLRA